MTYVIRRIAKTEPRKAWQVIDLLTRICRAYEEAGRDKAQIYFRAGGLPPGNVGEVIAEWTQESIEPNWRAKIPDSVLEDNRKLQELITEYPIEFYELVTSEKLRDRGLA